MVVDFQKKSTLNYHLAENLFHLIYSAGSPLFKRLNIVATGHALAKAMVRKAKGEDLQGILDLEKQIHDLREYYEPILDESPGDCFEKRSLFEMKLDEAVQALIQVINEYDLIDQKVLQDVYNVRFSKRKEE